MLKEFIQSVKEDPKEFVESMMLLITVGLLFYVSMWIFY